MTKKYDFDRVIDRHNTASFKWDGCNDPDVLPLWVADMDFPCPDVILEALRKRLDHGVFGYVKVPESYYEAVMGWWRRRYSFEIKREWFIYTLGIVPACSAIIKAMTQPGDKVLLQQPAYNCFFTCITNNGCEVVDCHLVYEDGRDVSKAPEGSRKISNAPEGSRKISNAPEGSRKVSNYSIDFEELEEKLSDPKVKVFILCNPHNPTTRVWTREELQKMGELCLKHNVFVIADEIHCDFVMPGYKYTPFGSIDERFLDNMAMCCSGGKSFNLAGLQIGNILVPNAEIRAKVDRAINQNEVCDTNPFGHIALQTAYNECGDWMDQLCEYIYHNYLYIKGEVEKAVPQVRFVEHEGTYLAWADCSSIINKDNPKCQDSEQLCNYLLKEQKLWINSGIKYGEPNLAFVRINLACPRKTLEEATRRFIAGLQELRP